MHFCIICKRFWQWFGNAIEYETEGIGHFTMVMSVCPQCLKKKENENNA
jgi:hypothetical protein